MSNLARTMQVLAGMEAVRPLAPAIIVSVVFAALARWVRGVTVGGAIAGAGICCLLYLGAGLGAFLVLVSVFTLTWLGTRFGYRRKEKLGTAERLDGRTAWQVLANLAVAAGCAGFSAVTHSKTMLLLGISAALSEAAADTVSSEVGQARSADARLVSNWTVVPAGTNGGVSWMGTLAGVAAGAFVSVVSVITGLIPLKWVGVSIVGAVAGMIADSFLGALLEQRKLLNNDAVNFLGTLIAAGAAALFV